MTGSRGLAADLDRLADLLAGRALGHLTERERDQVAGLQVRLIRARHKAGLYAEPADPEPLPARGREIAAAPWN